MKVYKYAELGKLSVLEFGVFFGSFLAVPIPLLFSNNIPKLATLTVLLVVYLLLLLSYIRGKKKKSFPKNYNTSLYLLLFSSSSMLFLTFLRNETVVVYGFVIIFFAYLFVVGIIAYFLFDFIFIFGLKKMFPDEWKDNKNQINRLGLKKLSKYIDLDKQKIYFSTSLINYILYLVLVFYGMLLFIKHQNAEQLTRIGKISAWVNNQDSISLFNGVSLFSLIVAIYTITFSVQRKIIKEAEQRYFEEYKQYM